MRSHKKRPHRRRFDKKKGKVARKRAMNRRLNRDSRVTSEYGEQAHQQCGRKVRYGSKMEALTVATKRVMRGSPMLRAYPCRY